MPDPATAAYTDADLLAIRKAIARGERSVTFADRTVTYRSTDELIEAENRIARALAASVTPRRRKQTRAYSTKGF